MTSAERLHKVMAAAGYCSRRQAEQLIAAGRVTVDGRVAVIGEKVTPSTEILVDGRSLGDVQRRYYVLLHKPVGVVSTLSDPQGRQRVVDLVRDIPARLYPVGRLDLTTSGLLLLTNDGDLAQHLAHHRHEIGRGDHVDWPDV